MLIVKHIKGRDVSRGLKINIKGYIRVFVKEGIHTHPRSGETMSMVELARAMHFGTATSPARPFLDDALRERWDRISALVKSSMVWRFKGLTAEVQYSFAANDVAEEVRNFIKEGSYYKSMVPNSKRTIEEKGGDTPLIDSEQLVNSIRAEYVKT